MVKKTEQAKAPEGESALGKALRELKGGSGGLAIEELDATILWLCLTALAERRASLTIGVTQDGSSWTCQVWEGKFPVKDYFRDTDELNRHLAAMVRVCRGNQVSPEIGEILAAYGW